MRIEDDLYLLLAKEFSKDVAVKLEADHQAAERAAREEAEKAAKAAEAAKKAAEDEAAKRHCQHHHNNCRQKDQSPMIQH
mgnify:CR=1 FL=1